MGVIVTGNRFSNTYKHDRFLDWYKLGKPPVNDFLIQLPLDEFGKRPSRGQLQAWMVKWKKQADILDREMELGVVEQQVAAKIEMLDRHAETGKEIQKISLDWLREHKEELTPQSAVKLLQVGVEIERESVGIPEALKKMQRLNDDDLLKEITSIINASAVTIEAIEDEMK